MESPVSIWEDPQCPFRVEWAPERLNEMRIAVVDAFYAFPRGGVEVGGVLLGRVEGKVIRIDGFTAMECEHLTGPSFVLSPKDEGALETQLAALDGKVVGWFHSHTRSDLEFSEKDVDIHNRFFPKSSQIAMVVRPANSQPPRANYFFRGPRGQMIGGANSFIVEPSPLKPRGANVAATVPVVRPVPEPEPVPVRVPVPVVRAVPAPPPPPRIVPPQVLPPIPVVQTEPVPVALEEVLPPAFLRPPEPTHGSSFLWPLAGLMVGIALCAALFLTRDLWMPK